MKNTLKVSLAIVMLLYSASKGKCQDKIITSDFELWNNFSFTKNIGKKLKLNLAEEFRFNDNASNLNKFFTEFSADYEIINSLKIGAEFRFYRHTKNKGGFEFQKRFRGMLSYDYKINRFNLNYKLSFQDKDENLWLNDQPDTVSEYNLRNKISIKYDIPNSKIESKISTELFRAYEKNKVPVFNKYRLTVKVTYPIFKNTKLEMFYRLNKELNNNPNLTSHIIGTGLNYKF